MIKRKFVIIGASVLAASLLISGSAFASGVFNTAAYAKTAEQSDKGDPGGGHSKDGFFGKGLDLDMSKYKDMEPDAAKAAMLADLKAALDEKVTSGAITQEKADEMYKKFESFDPTKAPERGGCSKGGRMTPGMAPGVPADSAAGAASFKTAPAAQRSTI